MSEPEISVITLSGYIVSGEAAALLGYTTSHVRYLCQSGHLPGAVKRGRDWLIPVEAVNNYKPGPQGFAAVKARREQEAAAGK